MAQTTLSAFLTEAKIKPGYKSGKLQQSLRPQAFGLAHKPEKKGMPRLAMA